MRIQLSDHFTYNKLLRFTLPAMGMLVFISLYGVVDGIFVSNFASKSALAAINFVYPILTILATIAYIYGAGGSALVAKVMGEGKLEKANQLFSLFVYITIFLSLLFMILGFLTLRPLMEWLGASGEMLDKATIYGNILLIAIPFWNLQYLFQKFLVTAEKPKFGLYVTILAGLTNMILDALFIAVFKWDIVGAAVATALSQIVGGGLPIIYFARKNDSLLRFCKTHYDGRAVLIAGTNGLSELITGVSGSLVGVLFNTQLLRYAGADGVAAHGVMMYVSFIFTSLFSGFATGSAPIVGYHFGAQNHKELQNIYKKSMVLTVSGSVLMLLISQAMAIPIVKLFAGYDAALYALTLRGFQIYAISYLFSGLGIFGSAFFTALNDGLVSAILSFMRTVVFQVACVTMFPLLWEIDGIWVSVVVAEMLSVVVTILYLVGKKKKYQY